MDHERWRLAQETVTVETEYHEFEVSYAAFGSGTPTVFLHGIPHWGLLFQEVYDAVEHPIVPDLCGYGYTRHVGEGGYDRSLRAQQRLVEGFLDEMGLQRVQLVGHDIGGSVALRLAVYTDRVERLVLSNVGCYDSFPVDAIYGMGLPAESRCWDRNDLESILDALLGRPSHSRRSEDVVEAYVEGMKAPFLSPDRDVTALSRNAIALNTNHTLEIAPLHEQITAPTLLLWGADNERPYESSVGKTTSEGQHTGYADRLADDIPDATKQYVEHAGHNVMFDQPDAYRSALRTFLD